MTRNWDRKKMQIADLQNEVAFLKQSEKVLEEELNSRRYRLQQTDNSDNGTLADELFNAKETRKSSKDCGKTHRLPNWDLKSITGVKLNVYVRSHMENRINLKNYGMIWRNLVEGWNRRADNEELTWALETSRKETERLNGLIEEQAQKLTEREKKLLGFSDRIRELEGKKNCSHGKLKGSNPKLNGSQLNLERNELDQPGHWNNSPLWNVKLP